MNRQIIFPCPKCGKPESSWDGIIYCPLCEEEYQKELREQHDIESETSILND